MQSKLAQSINRPELVTPSCKLSFQVHRLNYYHKVKQYNDRVLNRVLYPTNCALEPDGKFLKAVSNRKRSVNLHLLSYERQKEFFMLDNQFN
jgi:hypothetical protein